MSRHGESRDEDGWKHGDGTARAMEVNHEGLLAKVASSNETIPDRLAWLSYTFLSLRDARRTLPVHMNGQMVMVTKG